MDNSILFYSIKKLLMEEVAIGFIFFVGFHICWRFCKFIILAFNKTETCDFLFYVKNITEKHFTETDEAL